MFWLVPVILKIVTAYTLYPWLLKKVSSKKSREKRFALQFSFCAIFAVAIGIITGHFVLGAAALIITLIGVFNGLGAYCQWRAFDLSLSKTSIFTFFDDVIALTLCYIFLKEDRAINTYIIIGTGLGILSAVLFSLYSYRRERMRVNLQLLMFVGTYSVIWGGAFFFMRYFALKQIGAGTFLPSWYGGTLITALVIMRFSRKKMANEKQLTKKDVVGPALLGVFALLALWFTYWSYELAPQTVVQPIYLVAQVVVPTFIGLYFFGEAKTLSKAEWLFFGIGLSGSVFIVAGF
jgi:hypothetical protein